SLLSLQMVNVCGKLLAPKIDWLQGIKKFIIDMGIVGSSDIDQHVLSLDLASSRPKNDMYIVEVSDQLKKSLLTPNVEKRKKINDYMVSIGKNTSPELMVYVL
ncbi:hypothetical protein PENTCL1PPCAC_14965, partial [Pristionchus entomophagus]